MAVSNGDDIRIAMTWRSIISGDQVNVLNCRMFDAVGPVSEVDFLDGVKTCMVGLYQGSGVCTWMPDSSQHYSIHVTNVTTGLVVGTIGPHAPLNGASGGDELPSGTSALVLFRTIHPRVVGRTYLPSFVDGALTNGRWASGVLDVMAAFGGDWRTGVASDSDWILTGRVWRPTTLTSAVIQSSQPVFVPAYQRRRREGRGS